MGEKLKILEGNDTFFPHVDGVITCMHNYCLHAGSDVAITAMAPRGKNQQELPYDVLYFKSMHVPILDMDYGLPANDGKLRKELKKRQFDIVHCNSPFNISKFMAKEAKKRGIPATITFHSNMRLIFRQILKIPFLAEMVVKGMGRRYNLYDEVFCCSPLVAEQCRSYGYKGKISYLPFGTKIPKCNDKSGIRLEANEKYGLSEDELLLLFVGRIEKQKRVDFILKSLKILKDKGVKFRFFAVGKGSDIKKMQTLKEKLGFTDGEVRFLGFVDEAEFPYLYGRADVMLFPSIYDNFGLVRVEAAAYDTPTVCIKDTCAGYGITDGENGFLSENTEQAFAERIERAVQDRERLKEIGKNAGKDLYISWEECARQYVERLKEVAARYKKEHPEETPKAKKKK